jgi:surface protein
MNFDTQKVKNMNEMFKNCESLVSIDLTNMDTSIVTNMNIKNQLKKEKQK